jgi:23S rRNA (uracil1939-C5)-methyltransferase
MNHTIRIEKIIHGGLGLGRLENGIVVMTPFVLPNEDVLVAEIKKQRGYIEAEPVEILQSSPDRVEPLCKYYMQCGGCDLQHMNLTAQHKAKENIIRETLNRAGITLEEQTICPTIVSPKPFHYRYRIRLKISPEGVIGFHQAGSNSIIEIEYCHVATDILNSALNELRNSSLIEEIAHVTREIELLHSPSDDRVFCVLHLHKNKFYPQEKITSHLSSFDVITAIAIKKGRDIELIARDKEEYHLQQDFDASACGQPFSLSWTPGCFSQGNAEQNTQLIKLACSLAKNSKGKKILDLFCGMGNFSIPLAIQGAIVTGVERNEECINQANINALKLGLDNTLFFSGDVHKWTRKAVKHGQKFDIVLLDPPRQGMGKDIIFITELLPAKIIYISCDPATMSRDIAYLQNYGYSLSSIIPCDMFPQTHHIESIALLEKKLTSDLDRTND